MTLIECLRSHHPEKDPDCHAAADEIELLRKALAAAESFFNVVCFRWPGAVDQIESVAAPLRDALRGAAETPDPFRRWADAEVEKITDEEVARRLAAEVQAFREFIMAVYETLHSGGDLRTYLESMAPAIHGLIHQHLRRALNQGVNHE